jgi:hypothetical protein
MRSFVSGNSPKGQLKSIVIAGGKKERGAVIMAKNIQVVKLLDETGG